MRCIWCQNQNTFRLFDAGQPEKISSRHIPHSTITICCEGIGSMYDGDTVWWQSGSYLLPMFNK
jgi:hypothetical protein